MQKSEVIHARVAPDLKHSVDAILSRVGLSASEAITLFYRQIELREGLPFEVRIPNATTRAAMAGARQGKGMKSYKTVAALRHSVESAQKPKTRTKKT